VTAGDMTNNTIHVFWPDYKGYPLLTPDSYVETVGVQVQN